MKTVLGASIAAIALVAFAAGAISQRSGLLGRIASIAAPDASEHMPLGAVPTWNRPFVLVAAGQSNAANHRAPPARSGAGTFAQAEGGLYPLADPLQQLLICLLGLVVSIAGAWVFWRLIEWPSHQWSRRMFSSPRAA
ncbi:MAG: hypothetical protein ACOVNL_03295 [Prochlorococcaceae cyanobacterium]|jgi:hypothetical protein